MEKPSVYQSFSLLNFPLQQHEQPVIIAGPCAAESEEQLYATAEMIMSSDLRYPIFCFRAGVWKPRTDPQDFAGAGEQALIWLDNIRKKYDIPVCVEVANTKQVELCAKYAIDALWIGARTTVNPFIVQELADAVKGSSFAILVKNPLIPDLRTWIGAIERFLNTGIKTVIAIHRGFGIDRENTFRNAPHWEIPIALKLNYPQIPIICDASHIAGNVYFIPEIAQLAIDYGFNGLMLEVHHQPEKALSDTLQQLSPEQFTSIVNKLTFKSFINSSVENELLIQRNLINHIDTQISSLLKRRMDIVDTIADIKNKNNIPLIQPEQWEKVVMKYASNAEDNINYQQFIQEFLELLHRTSLARQKKKETNIL